MKKGIIVLLTLMLVLVGGSLFGTNGDRVLAASNDGYTAIECTDLTAVPNAPSEDYIFAGWYKEETCKTPYSSVQGLASAYAKFVPTEVLSVKLQLKGGTTSSDENTNMRIVSSVDSLNYKTVGFEIYYNGSATPVKVKSTTVYERIVASTESGVDYKYGPKVVDVESKYFVTATLLNINGDNFGKSFYIKPYWVTMDNTTVYGESRYVTVNNGLDANNINTPIYVGDVDPSDVVVKVGDTTYQAEKVYYEAPYAHLNVTVEDRNNVLPSLTKFDVSGTVNTSFEYRNTQVKYNGTADTSWYTEVPAGTKKFVIATSADLYGLAEIVNNTTKNSTFGLEVFKDKTVFMAADIMVNDGTAYLNEDGTGGFRLKDNSETLHPWKSIGYKNNQYSKIGTNGFATRFVGTFDGQGHIISGLYLCDDSDTSACYQGLFGITENGSCLKNFTLKNSYFVSKEKSAWVSDNHYYAMLGSVCAQAMGDMKSIYSDAIIVCEEATDVGGFSARLNPDGDANSQTIEDCWFDGKIYVTSATNQSLIVGGIAGKTLNKGTVNIKNSLNTGSITCIYTVNASSTAKVAGLIGEVSNNKTLKLNVDNCLNNGKLTVKETVDGTKADYTSGVAGFFYNSNYGSQNLGMCKNAAGKEVVAGGTSNVVVKNSISTYTSHKQAYQRANANAGVDYNEDGSTTDDKKYPMATFTNCISAGEANINDKFSGVEAYETAARLGIYTNDQKDDTKYWVVKEEGLIGLKSFTDEWIDFGWYYNNKTDGADTFVIETAEELYAFSHVSQTDTFSGDTIELGANIKMNLGSASSWADAEVVEARRFIPICKGASGATANAFAGTFDGKGYEVSGIYVYETANASNGFFGQVKAGSVGNFKLTNSCIINDSGTHNTGAIVGNLRGGVVSNVYTDAIVKTTKGTNQMSTGGIVGILSGGTKISNCWFEGEVHSVGYLNGGIVGRALSGSPVIENCISNGSVNTTYPGGEKVTASTFTGGILGGVYDATKTTIKNCLNMSTVTATVTDDGSVGAVVGFAYNKPLVLENVYTTVDLGGDITGLGNTVASTSTISGTPILISEDDLAGINAYIYTDFDFANTWGAVEGSTPVIKSLYKGKVMTNLSAQRVSTDWYYNSHAYAANKLTQSTTVFTVQDVADFYGFAKIVNDGNALKNVTVKLIKNGNFDLNPGWTASATKPNSVWKPIGKENNVSYFDGTFDGNMNTIRGVYLNETTSNSGLFGYVGLNGTVENFKIENSYFTSNKNNLSSVVGVLKGNVRNVYSSANIVNTASHTTGGIVAIFDRGADVTNEAEISNCWFAGTVTNTNATGGTYTGGVIGRLFKGKINVNNILNTGTVSSDYTKDYWAWAGGLIGGIEYGSGSSKDLLLVTLSDSVSAGEVYVSCGTGGSVYGRSQRATVTIENVYTTDNIALKEGSTATWDTLYGITGTGRYSVSNCNVTGSPVAMTTQLEGDDAYQYTELDFYTIDNEDGLWTAVENDTPVLKAFVDATASDYSRVQRISKGWYYNAFTYTKELNYENATTTYTIKSVDDMYGFADLVNNDGKTFKDNTVKIENDIIFNNVTTGKEAAGWADGTITAPTTSWVPIGTIDGHNAVNAFQGTFDGDGHAIKGLYVASSEEYLGLFRKIQDATICNLRLENSYLVNTEAAGSDSTIMGSIAGGGDGTLENIYSNAIVRGQRIFGGLIGRVSHSENKDTKLTLKSCWFDGLIDIDYKGSSRIYTGGLVGYPVHGTTVIDTCLYTGTIDFDVNYTGTGGTFGPQIGGLCSGDNGTTTSHVETKNSISAGEIHSTVLTCAKNPGLTYIGSVYGDVRHASSSAENTYALTKMTDTKESTGVTSTRTSVSYNSSSNSAPVVIDKTFMGVEETLYGYGAQMWTELPFTTEDRADGPIWAAVEGHLPVPATLAGETALPMTVDKPDTELAGTGTQADPWKITTVEELAGFAQLSKTKTFKGEYVVLANDIIINEGEDASKWVDDEAEPTLPWNISIGFEGNSGTDGKRFEGTFDGQGHTISGICFENASKGKTNYVGLFATTEVGSTVKNLRFVNSYIEQTGTGYTGAVIGDCRGTVSNVYSDAIVKTSHDQAGGIVGRANGYDYVSNIAKNESRISQTIDNCWYDGDIILVDEARYGGGIIGIFIQGEWTLNNCVFSGTITQEYNDTSYAYVGGICGALNTPGTIATSSMESTLKLNSCISAGTIKTSNNGLGAGAIVGRLKANVEFDEVKETVKVDGNETEVVVSKTFKRLEASNLVMNNVFATREAGHHEVGSYGEVVETDLAGKEYTANPTIAGVAVWTNNADRLVGYCTEEVKDGYYTGGKLDFNTFVIREEGVPVPNNFTDLDNVTPITNVDTILALTSMDSAWTTKNAVNYGLGHYVLTSTGKTYDNYTAYLAALEAQGFAPYTTLDETGTDGVYNVIYTKADGEWVLNVLLVQNTGKVTITISNGLDSLSPDLEPETSTTSGNVTVSMLQLEGSGTNFTGLQAYLYKNYFYGNSFVFKLPNGHFIINDGGNKGDMEGLMKYLRKEAGLASDDKTTKIYIDAWTVTHQHGDHFGVMNGIVSNPDYAKQLVVSAVYMNEPNQKAMLCHPTGTNVMNTVKAQYRGVRMLRDADGNMPKVYWCQTGQTYYFDGLTMDILQSQEQIPVDSYGKRNASGANGSDYNTSSTNMLFTTVNGKKVLITGDSNYVNMGWIMNAYGASSQVLAEIDVYQVMHHGKNTSYNISSANNTFTDYIASKTASGKIEISLFPCSVYYDYDGNHDPGAFPTASEANKYLIENKTTQAFNYGAGTIKVTLGDELTAGLDTSVDTGTEDTEIEEEETGEQ